MLTLSLGNILAAHSSYSQTPGAAEGSGRKLKPGVDNWSGVKSVGYDASKLPPKMMKTFCHRTM